MRAVLNLLLKDKYKGVVGHINYHETIIVVQLDVINKRWYSKGTSLINDIKKKYPELIIRRDGESIVIERN